MQSCPSCDNVLSEWDGGPGLYWCLQGCGEYFARNADDSVGHLVTDSSSRVARAARRRERRLTSRRDVRARLTGSRLVLSRRAVGVVPPGCRVSHPGGRRPADQGVIDVVSAIRMRVSARLRSRVWATVAVTAAIAIVVGAVVVVVAGARRTGTAPDRYTASVGGNVDGVVQQRSGPPLTDRIADLPGVKQIAGYTFVFGALESPQHKVPPSAHHVCRRAAIDVARGRRARSQPERSPRVRRRPVVHEGERRPRRGSLRIREHLAAQIASGQGFGGKPKGVNVRSHHGGRHRFAR